MLSDDYRIDVNGFSPSEAFQSSMHSLMDRLENKAPNDSIFHLTVHKHRNTYRGFIGVVSRAGRFTAQALNSSSDQLLEQLENSILKKLKKWKQKRFLQPPDLHLPSAS